MRLFSTKVESQIDGGWKCPYPINRGTDSNGHRSSHAPIRTMRLLVIKKFLIVGGKLFKNFSESAFQ